MMIQYYAFGMIDDFVFLILSWHNCAGSVSVYYHHYYSNQQLFLRRNVKLFEDSGCKVFFNFFSGAILRFVKSNLILFFSASNSIFS